MDTLGTRRPWRKRLTRAGVARADGYGADEDAAARPGGGDAGADRFQDLCGLPLTTYFSAPRLRWMLDHTPGLRARAERARLGQAVGDRPERPAAFQLYGGTLEDLDAQPRPGAEPFDHQACLADPSLVLEDEHAESPACRLEEPVGEAQLRVGHEAVWAIFGRR